MNSLVFELFLIKHGYHFFFPLDILCVEKKLKFFPSKLVAHHETAIGMWFIKGLIQLQENI